MLDSRSGVAQADAIPAAQSTGDYTPAANIAPVHWSITGTHALLWDGAPYVPAGGVFQPRSLADASSNTDDNWAADTRDLRRLKAQGITQLLIKPGGSGAELPITALPPAALQRLITYLDQNGFTYGLDLNAFPPGSLDAITVNPALYRLPDPQSGAYASVGNISGLTGGSYFLVSTRDKSIQKQGAVILQNADGATTDDVSAVAPTGSSGGDDTVLLVYPTRRFGPGTAEERGCPDFWSNADQARDDLLIYLGKIQFGSGLRFFVDPIRDDLGYFGAASTSRGFLPVSDAYRSQFQSWLNAKYSGRLTALQQAWRVTNEDLPDIATAARLVPLWNQGKGLEDLYDSANDKLYDANAANSAVWSDIRSFQLESMQKAMNGMADAVKKGVADVPVLYRWSQSSPITLNKSASGYDGLLVDSPLHGDDLGSQANGYALSDVEHARRTQWLVNELSLPDATVQNGKFVGYGTQEKLTGDSRILLSLGSRGFYVNALRSVDSSGNSLLDAPVEQLGWVRSQSQAYGADANALADQSPSILYYPANLNLPGTQTEELSSDLWWLPATFDSARLDVGQGVVGYTLPPSGASTTPSFVLYSQSELPQVLQLSFTPKEHPVVATATGLTLPTQVKKGAMTISVGQTPIIISGIAALPLPYGAITDEVKEINRLLNLGKTESATVQPFADRLFYITSNPSLTNATDNVPEYDLLDGLRIRLQAYVSPFLWIEGEAPSAQNFGSIVASPDISGGAYLWLDTASAPPAGSAAGTQGTYFAQYAFRANAPGDYDIWASMAPSGSIGAGPDTSSLTLTFDGGVPLKPDQSTADTGAPYGSLARSGSGIAGQFVWRRLSSYHLTAGDHTLLLALHAPSAATGRWTLGLDALCVSRGDFHPDGPNQPQP